MEDGHDISYRAGEFANSPAMQLIRRGREEGREEAWKEAQQQAETERKAVIRNLLKAGMDSVSIASVMGLSLEKLDAYLQEIREEEQASSDSEKD